MLEYLDSPLIPVYLTNIMKSNFYQLMRHPSSQRILKSSG